MINAKEYMVMIVITLVVALMIVVGEKTVTPNVAAGAHGGIILDKSHSSGGV